MSNRIIMTLILCCCLFQRAAGQTPVVLTGSVYNPVDGLASYMISYTVSNGTMTGFSITDYKNNNPLRTPITGRLEPSGRMVFRELPASDGKGLMEQLADGAYCYFTAYLKPALKNGVHSWSGFYTSERKDHSPCNGGNMYLTETLPPAPVSDRPLSREKRPSKTPVPVKPPSITRIPQKPAPVPPPEKPAAPLPPPSLPPPTDTPVRLAPIADTNGYQPLYLWNTDTLILEVWDGFQQDGDAIGISWNGTVVKPVYRMSTERVRLYLPLRGNGIQTLSIRLAEDGGQQFITPNAVFYDGPERHQLNISGIKGQEARIYFRRRRPDEVIPPK